MKKEYIIDYIDTAIDYYEENKKNKEENVKEAWTEVRESFEDESGGKGLYFFLIEDALEYSIKKIKKEGHESEDPKLSSHIQQAWCELICTY